MSAEMSVVACKCPHAQTASGATEQIRRADCCKEELVRSESAPAIRDSPRGADGLGAPELSEVAIGPVDQNQLISQVLAWRTSPPAQGPPVFLKIRTLLI
jgi:hypothetical protein